MDNFAQFLALGPWPIDGGLSGELEKRGHDLSDKLWSARLLRDEPSAISQVHQDYVDAGARVIITSSYQASRRGFIAYGLTSQQADELIGLSVSLAKQVASNAPHKVWVAASVGPYGAILGGGQEYVGNYGVSHNELVEFHAQRLEILANQKPDLFACETIPDLVEVEALLEALANFPEIPAWISMSAKDAEHTCAGQDISVLAEAVAPHPNIVAIGINCTKPEFVTPLFQKLSGISELPLVVYPNAGRVWDGQARCWIGEGHKTLPTQIVRQWADLGAKLIGGCCGLGPEAIESLERDLVSLR